MKTLGVFAATMRFLICTCAILALSVPSLKADPGRNHNRVVGVFTVTPLPEALLTLQPGLIESGAGFLFEDGTAVGFDQILLSPQALILPEEVDDFLSQDGVLWLDTPYTFEFTTWELRDDNTVRIRGLLFGGLFGLPEGFAGASLGGFKFSFNPVERDLIPFGGDGVSDHLEYIQPEPSRDLVEDVAEFLVGKGILTQGRAQRIVKTMTDLPVWPVA